MITSITYRTEADLYIRSHVHAPDQFGFVLKPEMPEWADWQAYFERKGLKVQKSFMSSRWANGYTVPCRRPEDFDPSVSSTSLSQRATPAARRYPSEHAA